MLSLYFQGMFYLDTQRTTTRRDSSLIATKKSFEDHQRYELEGNNSTARGHPSAYATDGCDSNSVLAGFRPKGSVRKELVTLMFDSMLSYIVDSWEVIDPPKVSPTDAADLCKSPSDLTVTSRKRKSIGKLVTFLPIVLIEVS